MTGASLLIFDKYEIIRRLAIGGMGEIFLARQTGLAGFDRLVILKGLLPELASDAECVEEFLDEARVAATLNHPNIVGIHEVGLWNGVYLIAMEYIEGEHLGTLQKASLELGRAVPFRVTARILHDAAIALHHAHTASGTDGRPLNIVHRDVSPQNIMVRRDGVAKVLDFGIAKAANRASRTGTGVLKGKLRYMPPEQLRGRELDGRSDQYSLGVVLWELCTGERLFKNQLHLAERLMDKPVTPPSEIVADVPAALEAIVLRMLRVEREERFSTCLEVASALELYLEQESSGGVTHSVAAYVKEVAGERILERTRDLTPAPENFLLSLRPFGEDEATRTEKVPEREAPASRRRGLALAVLLAACVAVGLALGLRGFGPSAPLTAEAGAPETGASPRSAPETSTPEPAAPGTAGDQAARAEPGAPASDPARAREPEAARRPRRPRAPPPAREAPAQGFLTLKTTPWTKVSIDGEPYGVTPIFQLRLAAGPHAMRLVNEDQKIEAERRIVVSGGETLKLDLELSAP